MSKSTTRVYDSSQYKAVKRFTKELKSKANINDKGPHRASFTIEHMSKAIIIGFVDKGWRMIKAYISIIHFSQTSLVKLEKAKCQKTSIDYLVLKLIRVIQGDTIESQKSENLPMSPSESIIEPLDLVNTLRLIYLVFFKLFTKLTNDEKFIGFPLKLV